MPVALRWPVAFSGRPFSRPSAGWEATRESSVRLTWRPLRATSVMPFLWLSSSSSTTMGRKMSCSSKRNRLLGSCSSTLVSRTNSVVGPVRVLRARRAGLAAASAGFAGTAAVGVAAVGAAPVVVAVLRGLAAAGLLVLRRGLVTAGAVSGAALRAAPVEGFRSSSSSAVCLAVLRMDEKASAESFAARWPGAGGRGIVDEPFSTRFKKHKAAWKPRRLWWGEQRILRSTEACPIMHRPRGPERSISCFALFKDFEILCV
ncbi:hypothetical protein SDC9_150728 [bioreactor metagenome]|uniref:Uncharacterized protein n=1 Tax=bioreactor metagenome TaxID=1076179 RepID=A0A645ENA4_9ZZZZ